MSNEVEVEFGDSAQDTATLLLAAAEELNEDPAVVRTDAVSFFAPEDVAKKAGVKYGEARPVGAPRVSEDQPAQEGDDSNEPEPEPKSQPAKKAAAKKAPAKKTAAKKSAAKKTAAKKTAAKKSTAKKS